MFSTWNDTLSCCMTTTKILHLFDFGMLFLALSLYKVYTGILYNNKVIHCNLKLILIIITTLDISILLVRIVDYLDSSGQYDFGLTLQNSIKMIIFSMEMLSLYNLLIERTIAIYEYQWYDLQDSAKPHIIIIANVLQFIFILIAFRMMQDGGAQLYVTVLFCFATVALLATLIYTFIARKIHTSVLKKRFDLSHHSISARYQMIENKRCDRVILVYIPYQVFSFFLTTILGGSLVFLVQRSDPRSFLFYQSLLYLTIAPRIMISMLIPLVRHPTLYKQFRLLFVRERKYTASPDSRPDQPQQIIVHSTNGQPLSFVAQMERDMYFHSYAAAWGVQER